MARISRRPILGQVLQPGRRIDQPELRNGRSGHDNLLSISMPLAIPRSSVMGRGTCRDGVHLIQVHQELLPRLELQFFPDRLRNHDLKFRRNLDPGFENLRECKHTTIISTYSIVCQYSIDGYTVAHEIMPEICRSRSIKHARYFLAPSAPVCCKIGSQGLGIQPIPTLAVGYNPAWYTGPAEERPAGIRAFTA